ncbi:MAG: S8 family serine peptidase [Phycisphaerae bacterium]|nr:S8 family serine peptidase [Phycisphaerae bacterium]
MTRRATLCVFLTLGVWGAHASPPDPVRAHGPAPKVWVYFTGKGISDPGEMDAALRALESSSDARALRRRQLRRTDPGLFDERDLPVPAMYLNALRECGVEPVVTSRWLNAASVRATPEQAAALAALPFVAKVEPVRVGTRRELPTTVVPGGDGSTRGFYGLAEGQLAQINLIGVHAKGHTGSGVIVGVLDTGFERRFNPVFSHPSHPTAVVGEHDFIQNDGVTHNEPGDSSDQDTHGSLILSVLGGYAPATFVGGAYDASFMIAKTEYVPTETQVEEDNYVAGLEWIEAGGADVATSSLGYIDWYTQADLDGVSTVTALAVNTATANGLHCCTAAGNEGNDGNAGSGHLITPADALRVITCGATFSDNTITWFSSDGPSADGRVKPEVLARGYETICAWPYTSDLASAAGTSLSTPLVASAVACLADARPWWTVDQMRARLFATASDQVANGQPDPLFVRGYGMVNALAALGCDGDYNADGSVDDFDLFDFLNVFFANSPRADFNGDTAVDDFDLFDFLNAFFGPC